MTLITDEPRLVDFVIELSSFLNFVKDKTLDGGERLLFFSEPFRIRLKPVWCENRWAGATIPPPTAVIGPLGSASAEIGRTGCLKEERKMERSEQMESSCFSNACECQLGDVGGTMLFWRSADIFCCRRPHTLNIVVQSPHPPLPILSTCQSSGNSEDLGVFFCDTLTLTHCLFLSLSHTVTHTHQRHERFLCSFSNSSPMSPCMLTLPTFSPQVPVGAGCLGLVFESMAQPFNHSRTITNSH